MTRNARTPPDTIPAPISATIPARIRARIHDSALKRVTRIYASTLSDVLIETLQNARRAGATRVRIAIGTLADRSAGTGSGAGETGFTVTVADDGAGIVDPAVLLSFGENGWSEELVRSEDAAGFGFASLSRRGCTVSSRPRPPDRNTMPGWRVALAPEHFRGEAEAEIHADDGAPFPHGTSISFQATETADAIRHATESAARHYPLPVFFEGIPRPESGPESGGETDVVDGPLERRAFLDGAIHAEPWRGLAFGVFRDRHRGYNDPDLNFHGLTLPVRLPTVESIHGGLWSVRADCLPRTRSGSLPRTRSGVGDCPDLELVLPARKQAVENDFLKEMRRAARFAIYRAMASDPCPRPAFDDWKRARDAGIDIAPPPPVLRPWRPGTADVDDWREPPKLAEADHHALVMACDPEPPEAQALWRAADCNGIAARLFEADRRLDGYDWYDGHDRVTAIATEVAIDGTWRPLDDIPLPAPTGASAAPLPPRRAAIRISLTVRPARGHDRTLDLPADLAFAGEAWSWVAEALPLVTADSTLQPHRLAELLRAGFFSASDDADADSWETQRDRFDQEALHIATGLLCSEDEARVASIAETVRRELFWLVPKDRPVEISICRPEVRVTLHGAVEAGS